MHQVAKVQRFSFSMSPLNEYSRLISFRIDSFDLLAVQGTFKSLLQYHNSKSSVLRHSAFFMVHLSHPYMTIEKAIALTIQVFVSKVMSVLFSSTVLSSLTELEVQFGLSTSSYVMMLCILDSICCS